MSEEKRGKNARETGQRAAINKSHKSPEKKTRMKNTKVLFQQHFAVGTGGWTGGLRRTDGRACRTGGRRSGGRTGGPGRRRASQVKSSQVNMMFFGCGTRESFFVARDATRREARPTKRLPVLRGLGSGQLVAAVCRRGSCASGASGRLGSAIVDLGSGFSSF